MEFKQRYRAILFGAGCALFVWLLLRLNPSAVFALLLDIGWRFVPVIAFYGCHQLLRAAAYRQCVSNHCAYWDLVKIRLSGEAIQFLSSTGPFLAEPAKAWFLRRSGVSARRAIAATILEYLIYSFTSAAFAVTSLLYLLLKYPLSEPALLTAKIVIGAMSGFLIAAAFAIVFRIYLIGALVRGVSRLPWVGKHARVEENDLRDTEDLLFVVLRDRPLRFFSILSIEVAAQMLLVLELFFLLGGAGVQFAALDPFLIEGSTKFVPVAFFFVPGQAGVTEGTYALVFQALGLSASAGFAVALARRLCVFVIAGLGLALAPVSGNPVRSGQKQRR
ncbi:MAG TPA: lysylphosphatidylglycerol synthase domain-containing protein [Bryobacteraceae bacterium]|nr:lysylphosphatidylglycerol synthase domain-containing protein [Bryobacteraceae bacterium]